MLVVLTNDSDMGSNDGANLLSADVADVVAYLNESPRHAVEVHGHNSQRVVAVFRGASDLPTNFYVQELPLEEPDADGGTWTAQEAVEAAVHMLDSPAGWAFAPGVS